MEIIGEVFSKLGNLWRTGRLTSNVVDARELFDNIRQKEREAQRIEPGYIYIGPLVIHDPVNVTGIDAVARFKHVNGLAVDLPTEKV